MDDSKYIWEASVAREIAVVRKKPMYYRVWIEKKKCQQRYLAKILSMFEDFFFQITLYVLTKISLDPYDGVFDLSEASFESLANGKLMEA